MGVCEGGADIRILLRVRVRVAMGIRVWVEMGIRMGIAVAVGMQIVVGVGAGTRGWTRVWVSARRVSVWSRSRSWSMMSAEVLVRLSLYLSCGLRVQAGAG